MKDPRRPLEPHENVMALYWQIRGIDPLVGRFLEEAEGQVSQNLEELPLNAPWGDVSTAVVMRPK